MHNHKDDSANLNIYVVCSYCKKIMDVKSGGKAYVISHGCCDECYVKEIEKIKEMKEADSKKKS
jgi:hypothetical protein